MTKETSPFRPALVIGLIVAGLMSFAAFVMLLTWGGQAGGRSGGRGTALSVAAIGFMASVPQQGAGTWPDPEQGLETDRDADINPAAGECEIVDHRLVLDEPHCACIGQIYRIESEAQVLADLVP